MRDVAIKVVNNPDARQQARFVREIMMLKACHDPNIVQFLGAAIHEDQTLLVMTYMPGGDLYGQIAKDDAGNFRWSKRYDSLRPRVILLEHWSCPGTVSIGISLVCLDSRDKHP